MKKNLDKIFDDYVQREYWGVDDLSRRVGIKPKPDVTEDDMEFEYDEGEEEDE